MQRHWVRIWPGSGNLILFSRMQGKCSLRNSNFELTSLITATELFIKIDIGLFEVILTESILLNFWKHFLYSVFGRSTRVIFDFSMISPRLLKHVSCSKRFDWTATKVKYVTMWIICIKILLFWRDATQKSFRTNEFSFIILSCSLSNLNRWTKTNYEFFQPQLIHNSPCCFYSHI